VVTGRLGFITYTSRPLRGVAILGQRGGGWALAGLVSLPTHHDNWAVLLFLAVVADCNWKVQSAVPHRTHIPRLVNACSSGLECSRKAPALNRIHTSTTLLIKKYHIISLTSIYLILIISKYLNIVVMYIKKLNEYHNSVIF
jgi:hypothetical protein